jgi:DNA replication and repair protein RecF
MKFNRVVINNVRNISDATIFPSEKFNFIYGVNGSGKTSLLESLYYFGHVRSFRSHLVNRIIKLDQEVMTLFSDLISPQQTTLNVGIQRTSDKDCKMHIQQQPIKTTADLAILLPIILINPDSFSLLDGGPKPRRSILDWGVFHVEHQYYSLWLRFQRCLKQRNQALKDHLSYEQIIVWDEEFCNLAEQIDQYRRHYYELLNPVFHKVLTELLTIENFKFEYHKGWNEDIDLKELLSTHLEQDMERGYTYYGPQRADLILKIGTIPLQDFLSRGQQKIVVSALRIAQAQVLREINGKECIFLVDDLPSELGAEYRFFLIEMLNRLNAQVFITAIEKNLILPGLVNKEGKMFHVEHGNIHDEGELVEVNFG